MPKTVMGGELRNESIACQPCSLNLGGMSLREGLNFCAVYLLSLSFPFCLLPSDLDLCVLILKEEIHQNQAF